MARLARTSLALALLAAPLLAQASPVGFRDFSFPNPTGTGSAFLLSTVYYPASQSGLGAPIQPKAGGHPVIVFLHGLGVLGSFYPDIGRSFAENGYVCVLSNTAVFDGDMQRDDGIALFPALVQANLAPGGFLEGALDMSRAGLAGHSMGGGQTVRVLAKNPGYKAGFGFAAWTGPSTLPLSWAEEAAALARAPLAFVHGKSDQIVPFSDSFDFFGLATGFTGLKVLNLLNADCNHTNVAILIPFSSAIDKAVFALTSGMAIGWFDRFLMDEPAGLEAVAGPTTLGNPRLDQHLVEVESPELWRVGSIAPGGAVKLHALAQPGPAATFVAAAGASLATPFGLLQLDLASAFPIAQGAVDANGLLTLAATLSPALAGAELFFQAIGFSNAGALRLSDGLAFVVGG